MKAQLGVCATALIVVAGLADATGADGQQARPPTFGSVVELVNIEVVATDGADRPVLDLARADFEIRDSGKLQTIADFRVVNLPVDRRPRQTANQGHLASDVKANALPSATSRAFVIIIDDLHLLASDIVPTQTVTRELIQSLSPDDEVAIVFVGRSDASQNFTTDLSQLLNTVDRFRDVLGFGMDALGRTAAGPAPMEQYARSTAFVLRNSALALADSGHIRRAIILLSGGALLDPSSGGRQADGFRTAETVRGEFERVFDSAWRANVPIYTVDPRGQVQLADAVHGGIGTIGGLFDSTAPIPGGVVLQRRGEDIAATVRRNIGFQREFLHSIANQTGGRAFVGQSNPSRAANEIIEENGAFYVLGYYPDSPRRDGGFHEIGVLVRRHGVRVRARRGYVASAANATWSTPRPLDAALRAGMNVRGLPLRASVIPLDVTSARRTALVAVELDYPASQLSGHEGGDEIRSRILVLDNDGRIRDSSEHVWQIGLDSVKTSSRTLLMLDTVELPGEVSTLRVGMSSQVLARAGTIQMTIEPVTAGRDVIAIGGTLIGTEAPAILLTADGGPGAALPFVPSLARTFQSGSSIRIYAPIFWRTADQNTEVTVSIREVSTGNQARGRITLPIADAGNSSMAGHGAVDLTLSLAGLVPGSYLLEISAGAVGGQSAIRRIPFELK